MKEFSYVRYSAVFGLIFGFWNVANTLVYYWSRYTSSFGGFVILAVSVLIIVLSLCHFKKNYCFVPFTIVRGLKVGFVMSFVGSVMVAMVTYYTMSDAEFVAFILKTELSELAQAGLSTSQIQESYELTKSLTSPLTASVVELFSTLFSGLFITFVTMAFIKEK